MIKKPSGIKGECNLFFFGRNDSRVDDDGFCRFSITVYRYNQLLAGVNCILRTGRFLFRFRPGNRVLFFWVCDGLFAGFRIITRPLIGLFQYRFFLGRRKRTFRPFAFRTVAAMVKQATEDESRNNQKDDKKNPSSFLFFLLLLHLFTILSPYLLNSFCRPLYKSNAVFALGILCVERLTNKGSSATNGGYPALVILYNMAVIYVE